MSIQASLPRFEFPPTKITQSNLDAIVNLLRNGSNYRILDGELQLKNLTTAKFNPIHSVNPDGSQTTQLNDGQS